MRIDWNHYDPGSHFDELLAAAGQPRAAARGLTQYLRSLSDADLAARKAAAELAIVEMGITFTVYRKARTSTAPGRSTSSRASSRPREWAHVERGLAQRADGAEPVHRRHLRRAEDPPRRRVPGRSAGAVEELPPAVRGRAPRYGVWAHICGTDLVRDARRHDLRAGGQPARALRRVLHAGEPRDHQARVPGAVRERSHPAGGRLPVAAVRHAGLAVAAPAATTRRSWCSRPASTTRPTSSTPSSPSAWAPNWSRAATWSSATTTASTCAPSTACSGWT